MLIEGLRIVEGCGYWLHFNLNYGAPFNMSVPILDTDIFTVTQDKDLMTPFSRWTMGRRRNTNFVSVGSGFEGHLCAFTPQKILAVLDELQNSAFRIMKDDVGFNNISSFIDNPSCFISPQFLASARIAFEVSLSKARAIRSMIQQGGYYYTAGGKITTIDSIRRERCLQYEHFIYNSPSIVDWKLFELERRTIGIRHEIKTPSHSPIPVEFAGGDIATNEKYKLLAEIGRFGHPMVPHILQMLT